MNTLLRAWAFKILIPASVEVKVVKKLEAKKAAVAHAAVSLIVINCLSSKSTASYA